MHIEDNPRVSVFQSTSEVAGILVLVAGGIMFLGTLKSALPDFIRVESQAALGYLLSGTALLLLQRERFGGGSRVMGQVCASFAAQVGLLTLAEYAFNWQFEINQLFFWEPLEMSGTFWPGRMMPATGGSFLLLGLALWLLHTRRGYALAQSLILLCTCVSLGSFLGYPTTAYTQMAVHTAGTFLVLSTGMLLACPERGLLALVSGDSRPSRSGFRSHNGIPSIR